MRFAENRYVTTKEKLGIVYAEGFPGGSAGKESVCNVYAEIVIVKQRGRN